MNKPKPIKLDEKLVNFLGNQMGAPEVEDLFGIEVEVEGVKVIAPPPGLQFWKMVPDGSLRSIGPGGECIEYVFKQPLDRETTSLALQKLFGYFASPKVKVKPSYRTSIHVHVNCLFDTQRTIANFITLAIIFDELFVALNGETRIGNNFCLRSRDAEGQIADLMHTTRSGSLWGVTHNYRYASVNYASLTKYGTIEFRSLECTTDLNRVEHWINTLHRLKVMARQYSNPKEIIQQFSRKGPLSFLHYILGFLGEKYETVPGLANMLQNGMRLAQDFAYCSDWELFDASKAPRGRPASARYAPLKVQAMPAGFMDVFMQAHQQAAQPVPAPGWQAVNEEPIHINVVDEDEDDDF